MTYADALRQVAAALESLPTGVVTVILGDLLIPECLGPGMHHVEMLRDEQILAVCLMADHLDDPDFGYVQQLPERPAEVSSNQGNETR